MSSPGTLTESLEDYLEAIFNIVAEKQAVRAKDISDRLNVSSSSVTGALRALAEKGLINYAPYDVITLTDTGRKTARQVVRRHDALRNFFVKVLAIDEGQAEDAACRMEHAVTREILERFIQFAEYVDLCPLWGVNWAKNFGYRCEHGVSPAHPELIDECEKCVSQCIEDIRRRKKELGQE